MIYDIMICSYIIVCVSLWGRKYPAADKAPWCAGQVRVETWRCTGGTGGVALEAAFSGIVQSDFRRSCTQVVTTEGVSKVEMYACVRTCMRVNAAYTHGGTYALHTDRKAFIDTHFGSSRGLLWRQDGSGEALPQQGRPIPHGDFLR